jgi:hypothetical protein
MMYSMASRGSLEARAAVAHTSRNSRTGLRGFERSGGGRMPADRRCPPHHVAHWEWR